jgi:transposase
VVTISTSFLAADGLNQEHVDCVSRRLHKTLKTHLKQPLLVIWDEARTHHSHFVRDYLDSLDGHIQIAFLPPYAPDLNPVEYLWAWLKRHAMANYCPDNLTELQTTARNKLKSAQKRPSIIAACWAQANLW